MAKKNCGCGQDPCVTFGAEKIHGDERLDRWVENNYGDEYDWAFLNEYGEYDEWDDAYDILEDFIVLDDDGNEYKGIAIIHRKEYDAETFEAPYAGSGSLFSVGSSDSLSGLSSKELTESSAIHGDFDSASLNYSGHQNLQVRAETFESMSWYDPGEDTNNLERAFRREYPRYTLDSGSMEYLIYQGGASNKFHIFFVAQDDGGMYHAFNAYGRIGYNPRIQYIGGPYSTKASAEYAFGKKMGQKTKKGYRPFGAEGSGSISAYTTIPYSWETDPDPHEHDENIDNYDIENAIEYEVDQEVRSGNRTGSSTYTTTVGYDDPENDDRYIQEQLEVDYRWGAEGDEIAQVELHNPIETGVKMTFGSMLAVVGFSALGGALLGLLNRTIGDE